MKTIRLDTLEMTCGGCPSQWDATTTDGEYVYIRVRHGYFYIKINQVMVFDGNPEGIDGVMSTSEMIEYVNSNANRVRLA